jgi:hypothetical protein
MRKEERSFADLLCERFSGYRDVQAHFLPTEFTSLKEKQENVSYYRTM